MRKTKLHKTSLLLIILILLFSVAFAGFRAINKEKEEHQSGEKLGQDAEKTVHESEMDTSQSTEIQKLEAAKKGIPSKT